MMKYAIVLLSLTLYACGTDPVISTVTTVKEVASGVKIIRIPSKGYLTSACTQVNKDFFAKASGSNVELYKTGDCTGSYYTKLNSSADESFFPSEVEEIAVEGTSGGLFLRLTVYEN